MLELIEEVLEQKQVIHVMRVIDDTGDTKIMWDRSREPEVDNARDTFNKMKKKGYKAYSVKKDGTPGEIIEEFDPEAEKIIMAPQMRGG